MNLEKRIVRSECIVIAPWQKIVVLGLYPTTRSKGAICLCQIFWPIPNRYAVIEATMNEIERGVKHPFLLKIINTEL